MAISKFSIKLCKLALTITVLYTCSFAWTDVPTEPFYIHKNQCTQISNLLSPGDEMVDFQRKNIFEHVWIHQKKLITSCRPLLFFEIVSIKRLGPIKRIIFFQSPHEIFY